MRVNRIYTDVHAIFLGMTWNARTHARQYALLKAEFLGVDVPDAPYPYVNGKFEFNMMIKAMKFLAAIIVQIPFQFAYHCVQRRRRANAANVISEAQEVYNMLGKAKDE